MVLPFLSRNKGFGAGTVSGAREPHNAEAQTPKVGIQSSPFLDGRNHPGGLGTLKEWRRLETERQTQNQWLSALFHTAVTKDELLILPNAGFVDTHQHVQFRALLAPKSRASCMLGCQPTTIPASKMILFLEVNTATFFHLYTQLCCMVHGLPLPSSSLKFTWCLPVKIQFFRSTNQGPFLLLPVH